MSPRRYTFYPKLIVTITRGGWHAKNDGSSEIIEGTNIIIATGSKPSTLPFIKLDKERIMTSTEALKLPEVPKHLIVIGGGVIGLELGSAIHTISDYTLWMSCNS